MDRNPKDSRQRYTKESLYASFLELLDEKAVSDITVIEICERAGVSRKTFYKYYSDQFALLMGMQNDLFEDYRDLISAEEPDIFRIAPTLTGLVGLVRHWLVDRPEWTVEEVTTRAFALMQLADPNR